MRKPVNNGASVRARLLNLARQRGQPFQALLTRFVLERLLYRLSLTPHGDRFVLKGAMLLTSWFTDPLRPTQDLDLLGFGNSDANAMLAVIREVCSVAVEDGVTFDVPGLTVEPIREELEYGGLRLKTNATIDGARIRVVIHIGFGDAVEPTEMDLPVLLDLPAPRLRAYPPESVIAEKAPGDGVPRPRQQPDEGLLRYLGVVEVEPVRRGCSCSGHPRDVRPTADAHPDRCPRLPDTGIRGRSHETAAMDIVCRRCRDEAGLAG